MGTPKEARSYREQQQDVLRQQAASNTAVDNAREWADETAEKIVVLINGQANTPLKEEFVELLLKSLGR